MQSRLLLVLLFVTAIAHADRQKAIERYTQAQKQLENRNVPKAEKLLLDSIQEDPNYIPSHKLNGDVQFAMRRYNAAADEYSTALKLNATQQTLNTLQVHGLTNQLGVSVALAGNLEKAKSIFDDAVKQDPDYPLYHYNLACTYAELGQLDPAIAQLQAAWKLRSNLGEGERFPDPRQDSSFKNYMNDPKFKEAVQYMVF